MIVCVHCKSTIEKYRNCRIVLELWAHDPIVSTYKDPKTQGMYSEHRCIKSKREDLCEECKIKLVEGFDKLTEEFGFC